MRFPKLHQYHFKQFLTTSPSSWVNKQKKNPNIYFIKHLFIWWKIKAAPLAKTHQYSDEKSFMILTWGLRFRMSITTGIKVNICLLWQGGLDLLWSLEVPSNLYILWFGIMCYASITEWKISVCLNTTLSNTNFQNQCGAYRQYGFRREE